jgi:hypothetical protein
MCPVRAWVRIIQRIRHRKHDTTTSVNTFYEKSKKCYYKISQADTIKILRDSVNREPHRYPYRAERIGSHSIRSGAAMALYMADCPAHMIMILGRWCSDAFLLYLRPQVIEATNNLSKRMMQVVDYHQPPPLTNEPRLNVRHNDDPTLQNNTNSITSRAQNHNNLSNGFGHTNAVFPRLHTLH